MEKNNFFSGITVLPVFFFFFLPSDHVVFLPWRCLLQSNLIWSDWYHFVSVEDCQLDYLIFLEVFCCCFFEEIDREMQFSCACVHLCVRVLMYVHVCMCWLPLVSLLLHLLSFSSSFLSCLFPSSPHFSLSFFSCVCVCVCVCACVCVCCFSSHSSHQLWRQLYTTHLHCTLCLVLIIAISCIWLMFFFLWVLWFSHSSPEMFGTGFLHFLFQGRT